MQRVMDPTSDVIFTPWSSLLGGILIGVSAVLLMAGLGKIAGITGITGHGLFGRGNDRAWGRTFLLGLLASSLVAMPFMSSAPVLPNGMLRMALAGLFVGVGTALGSGCTSGHGVCGMARLSPRSFAAVGTFLATGALTVFFVRLLTGAAA